MLRVRQPRQSEQFFCIYGDGGRSYRPKAKTLAPSPFDIDEGAWTALQEKTMSLKPQVGGYFDYGGTFSALKNGEMLAMVGIGDWITGVLEKDGAKVASVIPEEGGIQWTESYSIGKGTTKQEIINKFITYMLGPKGQVKSIQMAAYPGLSPTKSGWKAIQEANPDEAKRSKPRRHHRAGAGLLPSGDGSGRAGDPQPCRCHRSQFPDG